MTAIYAFWLSGVVANLAIRLDGGGGLCVLGGAHC